MFICGPRVGARGLEPFQGASGKAGPLRGLCVAHLVPRSVENEHTSQRPLNGLSRPLRAFPGLQGAPGRSAPRGALEMYIIQELSGDPNPQYFPKSTAVQMGGVLPYKWEAYCSTNGRCTVAFPFPPTLFPSFSSPLYPSGPVHSPATSPLFTSPFIPPFLTP